MGVGAYLSLAAVLTKWVTHLHIHFVFTMLRNLLWLLKGTYFRVCANRRPENYGKSAQRLNILCSHRVDPFVESRLSDFYLTHDRFLAPEYVLQDNIFIVQVTETEAIFVERKKDARRFDDFAFSIIGILDQAVAVVVMPLSSLVRLSTSMGPCDGKMIFLHNQARCGGTLFTELFKATGRCITFNEPHALNGVCKQYYIRESWNREYTMTILQSVVRLLCKTQTSRGPEKTLCYVIKPTATSTICADLIEEAIPDALQFFIYRDPVNVAVSLRRIAEVLPSLKIICYSPNLPNLQAFLFRTNGYVDIDYRGYTPTSNMHLTWGFRLAATTMMRFLRYTERGVKIHGVRYEVLRDNKDAMTEKIMTDVCGMPRPLVDKALEAFGRDSQEVSPISMATLKRVIPNPPVPDDAFLAEADEMSRTLKVPGRNDYKDQKYSVPGSLTP